MNSDDDSKQPHESAEIEQPEFKHLDGQVERTQDATEPGTEIVEDDDWDAGELEDPLKQIGPYQVLEKIGEGGMGSVFRARQIEPIDREVALKVIKDNRNSVKFIARFEAERQALAMMDHPNIAKILDAGTTQDGSPFFAMELVNGVPLNQFCNQRQLAVSSRLELFVSVCNAVQHAHQKGIIHRDLKPSNVLVGMYDGVPLVKVIDFGLAKAIDGENPLLERARKTQVGKIAGTLQFMSPEQATMPGDIDTRTDVYSLGVILYSLLTGSVPLDASSVSDKSLQEIVSLVQSFDPPKPSERLRDSTDSISDIAFQRQAKPKTLESVCERELDWVVMKAIDKDRRGRYATPGSLAADVIRFLDHEPVLAHPDSAGYRWRKFIGKNRGAVLAIASIAAILLVGIGFSSWFAYQATKSAKSEKLEKEKAELRLQQVEASNGVLAKIFSDLNITEIRKGSEPVEAILAKRLIDAAEQLKTDAIQDPVVTAKLLDEIGRSLVSLGFANEAKDLHEQASQTLSKLLGETNEVTLIAESNLAAAYEAAGLFDQALAVFRRNVDKTRETLGENHAETLKMNDSLAVSLVSAGRITDGVTLHEKTLDSYVANFDEGWPDRLICQSNLSSAYQAAGRLQESLSNNQELLKIYQRVFGMEHPRTLVAKNNLGRAHERVNETAKAVGILREVLETRESVLGRAHPDTLHSLNNLGSALISNGELSEGVQVLESALNRRRERLGENHLDTIYSANNLAESYQLLGQPAKARPFTEQAYKWMKAKRGDTHPDTLVLMSNLGRSLLLSKEFREAAEVLVETAELISETLGPEHPSRLFAMSNLGEVYLAMNELEQARDIYDQAYKLAEPAHGENHRSTNLAANGLGVANWRLKKFAAAKSWFEKSLKVRIRLLTENHPASLVTAANLGTCLRDMGDYAEAIVRLEKVASQSDLHPHLSWVKDALRKTYQLAGENEKYVVLVNQQLELLRTRFSTEQPVALAERLELLADEMLEMNEVESALGLYREACELRLEHSPGKFETCLSELKLAEVIFQSTNEIPAASINHAAKCLMAIKSELSETQTRVVVKRLGEILDWPQITEEEGLDEFFDASDSFKLKKSVE